MRKIGKIKTNYANKHGRRMAGEGEGQAREAGLVPVPLIIKKIIIIIRIINLKKSPSNRIEKLIKLISTVNRVK